MDKKFLIMETDKMLTLAYMFFISSVNIFNFEQQSSTKEQK